MTIPFPQANSVPKLMSVIQALRLRPHQSDEIANVIEVGSSRQGDYYPNALSYLGIAARTLNNEGKSCWALTDLGFQLPKENTELATSLGRILLQVPSVRKSYELLALTGVVTLDQVRDFVRQDSTSPIEISTSTEIRRAQCILNWAKFCHGQIQNRSGV